MDPARRVAVPGRAATDEALRAAIDIAALGLPPGARIEVRWRTPTARNPRRRTFGVRDAVAIASDIVRAARAPHDWSTTSDNLPALHLVAGGTAARPLAPPQVRSADTARGPARRK